MFIDHFLRRNGYTDFVMSEDSDLFNMWSQNHPEYIIHYKTSPKSDIITVNESSTKTYHIIWDISFWDLFTKFYYINDEQNFSPRLDSNISIENNGYMVALFFSYLSKRYSYYPELSEHLNTIAQGFGYPVLLDNLYSNEHEKQRFDFSISLCEHFVFWHEIAHAEFHKFDAETLLYQKYVELIYSILEELLQYDLCAEIPHWKEISPKIRTHTVAPNLIEELAADLRAIQRMMEFESISGSKKNLLNLIKSIVFLIDFSMLKSVVDKRWDHYVDGKLGDPPNLIENQIIRQNLFPQIVYIRLGLSKLGSSFAYDIKELRNNIFFFAKLLGITCNEWYVKSALNKPVHMNPHIYHEATLLNTVYRHMSTIDADNSSKRIKYLFNLAHTAQHSNHPLDAIPKFFQFIDVALKKEHENKRNIGDAYSRIARIYAENGQPVKSEILLNNAIDIATQLSDDDICNAFLFNNIGNVFKTLGKDNKAFEYYIKSMEMRLKNDDIDSINIATVYRNIGSCRSCGFYQSLKYYLKSYLILKSRYDKNDSDLIDIQKCLEFFADYPNNSSKIIVPFEMPLSEVKKAYEHNRNNDVLLEKYLFCMIRDLLSVSFDEACHLYIKIVELVEVHINYPILSEFYLFAFTNFQNSLKQELKKYVSLS